MTDFGAKNCVFEPKTLSLQSHPPYGVGTWHFKTLSVTLRSSGVLGVPNIFWSAWLILGQKIAFLILKRCHSTSQSPFGIGTWSLDREYFSIVFFGVRKCWLCLTDFGLENYVFYLKTLFGYILAPFQSLDFIFGHNVLQHCFLWPAENFATHDWFWAKNCIFDGKSLSGRISVTFWRWDFIFGHNVLQYWK